MGQSSIFSLKNPSNHGQESTRHDQATMAATRNRIMTDDEEISNDFWISQRTFSGYFEVRTSKVVELMETF